MFGFGGKTAALLCVMMTGSVVLNLFLFQGADQAGQGGTPMAAIDPALKRVAHTSRDSGSSAYEVPIAHSLPMSPRLIARVAEPVDMNELTRSIQRELAARGYEPGQADGVIGNMTRAAIMAFEHDFSLPLTATPSQALLGRIVLGSSHVGAGTAAAAPTAAAERVVRNVKQRLAKLGYKVGELDTELDSETVQAIRQFERDQKLADTGRISGALMWQLLTLRARSATASRM